MKRILIAEDEKKTRELYARLLKKAGYKVFECEDGQQALEVYLNEDPDLLLVDLNMGTEEQSGTTLIEEVRDGNPEVPIIVISANRDDVVQHLNMGANDYIKKGALDDLDEIVARINLHIGKATPGPTTQGETFKFGDFSVKKVRGVMSLNKPKTEPRHLTSNEYEMLKFFKENENKEVPTEDIIVYFDITKNSFKTLLSQLRRKLGEPIRQQIDSKTGEAKKPTGNYYDNPIIPKGEAIEYQYIRKVTILQHDSDNYQTIKENGFIFSFIK